MPKDLRSFIQLLKEKAPGEIFEVEKEVDPYLEVTAIIGKLEKSRSTALLYFRHPKDHDIPIVCNAYYGYKKLALTMEVSEEEVFEEYLRRKARLVAPKEVSSGPCKDVILKGEKIDVTKLPVVTTSPKDDAPYITTAVTIAKDIETGRFPYYNLGIYRHRIISKDRIGMYYSWGKYLHYLHKKAEDANKEFQVALAIGQHPAVTISAMDQNHTHELELAGSLMGEPIELVKCETVDLHVPAQSEIVIEGVLKPGVRQTEGPFGEYPGYYGHIVQAPQIEITCITHRSDPIYQHASSGMHAENVFFPGMEFDLLATLRKYFPTVRRLTLPFAVAPFYCFISMKKMNEGDAISVGIAALGLNSFLKYAVVVDEEINIYDERNVLWAISNRVRADEDIVIIPNAKGNRLDPMTYTRMRTSRDSMVTKMVIDATTKTGLSYEVPEPIEEPLIDKINLKELGIDL